jgi:hypothetical protein
MMRKMQANSFAELVRMASNLRVVTPAKAVHEDSWVDLRHAAGHRGGSGSYVRVGAMDVSRRALEGAHPA